MFTGFFKGTLVKRETTSNETNTKLLEFFTSGKIEFILLTAWNESFMENWFCVSGYKTSDKYFPTELWVVPIVSIIGGKGGISSNALWTFGRPCALAIFACFGQMFLYTVFGNSPLLLSCLRYLCNDIKRVGVGSL